MGYPDQARAMGQTAVEHAREIQHANTMAYVLFFGDVKVAHFRRDLDAAVQSNAALLSLANDQGLALWKAYATVQAGWVSSLQGDCAEAIVTAQTGLDDVKKTGTALDQPFAMAQLIEVLAASGQHDKALDLSDAAIELVDRTNERLIEAELYRLKGEQLIHVNGSSDLADAERLFLRSLDIARNQQAKSWELRTATSLARLWRGQGKTDEACQLLAPVFDWFTEGFDTTDLEDAKALLDELR
jgi:predicted ATPase